MASQTRRTLWPSGRGHGDLRIVQYNVLADGLSAKRPDHGGFADIDPKCLEWESRYERIAREILQCDPHVVGLEEVDHPESFMQDPRFADYHFVFKPKPTSAATEFGGAADGCLLMYRKSRFEGVVDTSCSLGANASQVAACAVVEDLKYTNRRYLFCCAHFKASKNAEGEATRVKQVDVLVANLLQLRMEFGTVCTFVCADLNAVPTGEAYARCNVHGLKSSMAEVLGAEPEYTTCKQRVGGSAVRHTIDYILYNTEANIKPIKCLEVPADPGFMPSWDYPSDHLMLCVTFATDFMLCDAAQVILPPPKDVNAPSTETGDALKFLG